MLKEITTADLAREFDLTTRAIRHYESMGLIAPSRRGRTRIFSQRDRVRLGLIARGRRLGLALEEIREIIDLYDAERGEERQILLLLGKLRARRARLQEQVRELTAILDELDAVEESCIQTLTDLSKGGNH
ncbi:MAG: MerR family DNA-binding transcriptional regulator [Nisaea sp.]|uniref:MerR family transcriptional regulator n=1 Tax=Nisaea sp. TaxID=2024842 RepID=UPI001B080EEC|nr:MerR family DNA-binding transcriptional regulator [Nisaea sp.]MBO6562940.1 MerR family DNA-binding transcriptional regulator [Nisaea sp.]